MIECLIVILTQEKFNTTENETAAEVSMKYKSKRDDCRERIHDNRRSHFQFGSNVDFKHSEQVICGLTLMITVYFFSIFSNKDYYSVTTKVTIYYLRPKSVIGVHRSESIKHVCWNLSLWSPSIFAQWRYPTVVSLFQSALLLCLTLCIPVPPILSLLIPTRCLKSSWYKLAQLTGPSSLEFDNCTLKYTICEGYYH